MDLRTGRRARFPHLLGGRVPVVEVLLVGVHPHLGRAHRVLEEVGPGVGRLLGEDVAYVGAGVDLQRAPALPPLSAGGGGMSVLIVL